MNSSLKNKIIGTIFIIWFIGSIFAMLFLSRINGYYSVMVFGQYFLVFGMLPLMSKDGGKLFAVPFLAVGVACIVIPFMMLNPNLFSSTIEWDAVIVILFFIACIIAGLCMVFMPIIKLRHLKSVCTVTLLATISKYKSMYGENGRELYCPIYSFEFNNKKYEVVNEEYTNGGVLPEGTMVDLKINPNNPNEFLDNSNFFKPVIVLGALSLIVSVPLLFYFISGLNW